MKTLNHIKNKVLAYLPGSEVRLFGSRTRPNHDSESDYDILVITNQRISVKEKLILKTRIRKGLLKENIRTDILIQSKKDISVKKTLPGHIIRNIMNETILL
ncbi:MAG: nucleotidyltransferase family protein [Bacteroidales bacterium]